MIVKDYEQYESLKSRMDSETHLYIPIYRDLFFHRIENETLCVGIVFNDRSTYVVSVTHKDAPTFEMQPNANSILPIHVNGYLYENRLPISDISSFYTPYITDTLNKFGDIIDANKIIPLTLWLDVILQYTSSLEVSKPSPYMMELIDVLETIENSALAIDMNILSKYFDERVSRSFKNSLEFTSVFTEYNPFTATGRPSNRFGHINFAALNKHDGTRDAFISRYEHGELIQFDFEAYHIRLIADEFNIYLPTDQSLHESFARLYFNTDNITEELYEESKKKTFEILYGVTPNDYGIELFRKIREFRSSFQNENSIKLPSGVVVTVDDPSPSKLFNYYIQSLETVRTLPKLRKVIDLLKGTNNHLVLYTYDSILIDVENYDTNLVSQIKEILEENGKFPVRIHRGLSYGVMQSVD